MLSDRALLLCQRSQCAVAVADGAFRFAQRVGRFGFGFAGFFQIMLQCDDALAQIVQFFLLRGMNAACVRQQADA